MPVAHRHERRRGLGGVAAGHIACLPDGAIPPNGSIVFGYSQPCDYVCNEYDRVDEFYWLAHAAGPKPA